MTRSEDQADCLQTETVTGTAVTGGGKSVKQAGGRLSTANAKVINGTPENDTTVTSTSSVEPGKGTAKSDQTQSLNLDTKSEEERILDSGPPNGDNKAVLPILGPDCKTVQYIIVPKNTINSVGGNDQICRVGVAPSQANDESKTVLSDRRNIAFIQHVQADGKSVNVKIRTINGSGTRTDSYEDGNDLNALPSPGDAFLTLPKPLVSQGLSSCTTDTDSDVKVVISENKDVAQSPTKALTTSTTTTLPGTNLIYRTPGANNINKNGKVKRPMNAFMVWARTYRAKLADEFPNTTNSDVSVRLGQVWNEMTDHQKRPYYQEAERIKQRHKMQYPDWSYTPTPARRRPDELSGADNIAHNVYWARYNTDQVGSFTGASVPEGTKSDGGDAYVRLQVTPRLLMQQPTNAPVTKPPAPQSKHVPVTSQSPLGTVYKPVPLKPLPIQIPHVDSSGSKLSGPDKSTGKATETRKKNHMPGCPGIKEKTEETTCQCSSKTNNGAKKRGPRKPRSRRKDDRKTQVVDDSSSMLHGVRNDLRCQQLSDSLLNTLPQSDDSANLFDGDYPSDPYNPFYLMDLEEDYLRDPVPDDVDVDRWKLFLDERIIRADDIKTESDHVNLDVFLSEARVSQSATSHSSSDIEILPTPLSTTLQRLKPPDNPMPRWSGSMEESSGSHRHFAHVSQANERDGTPRPKDLSKRPETLDQVVFDLLVDNEVVVETTPLEQESDGTQVGHVPDVLEQTTKDRRGGGDSVTSAKQSCVKEPHALNPNDASERPRCTDTHQDGIHTVSPPGKRPCV